MSSLFWKIFLWFWFAIVLLIGSLFIATVLDDPEKKWDRGSGPYEILLSFYGQTSLEVLETGGRAALTTFLRQVGNISSARAYIFTAEGEEVTGREFPDEAQALAVRNLRDSITRPDPYPFLSHPLVDKNGQRFALIIQYRDLPVEPARRIRPLELLMILYGQTALDLYTNQGRAALISFLDDVGTNSFAKAYLFTAGGEEVTGREYPDQAGEVAAQTMQPERRRRVPFPFASSRLAGPDGKEYAVVLQYDEIPLNPPKRLRKSWFVVKTLIGSSTAAKVLVILVVAGMVCFWLAFSLTRPVVKLRAATQALAGGDLATRVGPAIGRRRDELANLAEDFDRMAERMESLVNSQRLLLRDIAHELRSPLSRLYVALELARPQSSDSGKKALERIELEASRLTDLIQGLLDLARLEGGAEELERESFDLKLLLKAVLEDAKVEAEAKRVRLEVAAAETCLIFGSPNMVRTAVENVLRNAVHYAPESSSVRVRLQCAGDGAEIVIRDQGPGVPEGELDDIFTPFYRVGKARDRKTGGSGLGLSITRRIVSLHGGVVVAENQPGGGLSVTIRLPVSEVPF